MYLLTASQVALDKGIRFCLSDDSHGVNQVAYGYSEAIQFVKSCGIHHLWYAKHVDSPSHTVDNRFPGLQFAEAAVVDL